MKIRYAKRAYSDLEQILDYLRARSPTGAANVLNRIETALEILAEQPLMGHATNVADVRVLFVGRYPYKIFYRRSGNDLESRSHTPYRSAPERNRLSGPPAASGQVALAAAPFPTPTVVMGQPRTICGIYYPAKI